MWMSSIHHPSSSHVILKTYYALASVVSRVRFVGGMRGIFPLTGLLHPRHWLVRLHPCQGCFLSHALLLVKSVSHPLVRSKIIVSLTKNQNNNVYINLSDCSCKKRQRITGPECLLVYRRRYSI